MLELKNIRKTFNPGTVNEKVALNGLNLTLNDGDFVTVIGGNGAGKSTMLNLISGVFPADAGTITLNEAHDAVRPVVFKQVQADGTTVFKDMIEP